MQVVTQDLPPAQATDANIKAIINAAVGNGTLISIAVCQGPNQIQRLIVVFK